MVFAAPVPTDVNVGVILSLSGPAAGLRVPTQPGLTTGYATLDGAKTDPIILDEGTDETDATRGAVAARKLVPENDIDLIVASGDRPPRLKARHRNHDESRRRRLADRTVAGIPRARARCAPWVKRHKEAGKGME